MITALSRDTILKKEEEEKVDCVKINGRNWYSATLYFFSMLICVLTLVSLGVSALLQPLLNKTTPFTRYLELFGWGLGLASIAWILEILMQASRKYEVNEAAWIAAQCAANQAAQKSASEH